MDVRFDPEEVEELRQKLAELEAMLDGISAKVDRAAPRAGDGPDQPA